MGISTLYSLVPLFPMRLKSPLFLFILFCLVGCAPSASTLTESIPTIESVITTEAASPIDYEAFIGSPNRPLPDGFETKGGFLISQHPQYEFELVLSDGVYSIWFSENKVVKDVLVLPELVENAVIAAQYCQLDGKVDPFIFAIARLDREAFEKRFLDNSHILQTWRTDPKSGVILEIPTTGIECGGEGGFDPNNVIYQFSK